MDKISYHPRRMKRSAQRVYTPYGYTPPQPFDPMQLGFNGERLHLGNLYLLGNGYRPYQSTLCRFLSPDSLSPFHEGGINAYAYCSGDPVNHTDPSGHLLNRFMDKLSVHRLKRKFEKMTAKNNQSNAPSKDNTLSAREFRVLENHMMDKVIFSSQLKNSIKIELQRADEKSLSPLKRSPPKVKVEKLNEKISHLTEIHKAGTNELAYLRSLKEIEIDEKPRYAVAAMSDTRTST